MRYAVIGAGMMGQEHIRNIQLLGNSEIVAIADPDQAMRQQSMALAGSNCQGFNTAEQLLDAELAEALVIASPNHTHYSVLEQALATELPILVEKPLCTTLADCNTIMNLAKQRNAPVWVAMEYRYMPAIARLIESVSNGDIGDLKMLSIRDNYLLLTVKEIPSSLDVLGADK